MWNLKLPKVSPAKLNCNQLAVGSVYRGNNQLIVTPIYGIGGASVGLNGCQFRTVLLVLNDEGCTNSQGSVYNPSDLTAFYEYIGEIKEIVVE